MQVQQEAILIKLKREKNLTIETHATTDIIEFDGKKAIGVRYFQGKTPRLIMPKSIEKCCCVLVQLFSPQILQRSGIGPEKVLDDLIFSQYMYYPGWENLQDHLEMYLQYECKKALSLYPALNGITNLRLVRNGYSRNRNRCK